MIGYGACVAPAADSKIPIVMICNPWIFNRDSSMPWSNFSPVADPKLTLQRRRQRVVADLFQNMSVAIDGWMLSVRTLARSVFNHRHGSGLQEALPAQVVSIYCSRKVVSALALAGAYSLVSQHAPTHTSSKSSGGLDSPAPERKSTEHSLFTNSAAMLMFWQRTEELGNWAEHAECGKRAPCNLKNCLIDESCPYL